MPCTTAHKGASVMDQTLYNAEIANALGNLEIPGIEEVKKEAISKEPVDLDKIDLSDLTSPEFGHSFKEEKPVEPPRRKQTNLTVQIFGRDITLEVTEEIDGYCRTKVGMMVKDRLRHRTVSNCGLFDISNKDDRLVDTIRRLVVGPTKEERKQRKQHIADIIKREKENLALFQQDEVNIILDIVRENKGFGKRHWGEFATAVLGRLGRDKVISDVTINWIKELRFGQGLFGSTMKYDYDPSEHFISYGAVERAMTVSELKSIIAEVENEILAQNPKLQREDGRILRGCASRMSYICDIILLVAKAFDAKARSQAEEVLTEEVQQEEETAEPVVA